MKNAEAAISSRRRSKKFEDWSGGLKNFRTAGGYQFGTVYFCWVCVCVCVCVCVGGGVSTPLHAMVSYDYVGTYIHQRQ